MANRRMFSRNTTSSSRFLKMPSTSRLLWYDLGMNADDDGYVEYYGVMKVTGASDQDLNVLAVNGLVKVFDDMVLWITNWKENNYIRGDTYTESRYKYVYPIDSSTPRPLPVDDPSPQVRIGKVRIGKDKEDTNQSNKNKKELTTEDLELVSKELRVSQANVEESYKEMLDYIKSRGRVYKDYTATLRNWIRRSIKDGKMRHVSSYELPGHKYKEVTDEQRKQNLEKIQELKKSVLDNSRV